MYRPQPKWYNQGLSTVASRFSSIFTNNSPPNLQLLPSFSSQDLLPDGRHLTPVAGLHFILHLFDQSDALLSRINLNSASQLALVQEQVRHHEDRMSYIENHHAGLRKEVSHKVATDAEVDDFVQNRSEEDWIVIQGLPRLTGVTRQEWPNAVKKQVVEAIVLVLRANRARLEFEVLHVSNPFRLTTTGPTTLNVKLDSAYTAKRLREVFSGFFRHHDPVKRPPGLKGVSFRNKITLETKVRIAILHQLGIKYTAANPGSFYKVRGYDPRPTILITPPRSSTEHPRTYNFIQASKTLPASFGDEHLIPIFQVVGDRFRGKLEALFIVLNDDDHDRCLELVKTTPRVPRAKVSFALGANAHPTTSSSTTSGLVAGDGTGTELESGLIESLHNPPPPPSFGPETALSRAHDERVRLRREQERQPTPEDDHSKKAHKHSRRRRRSSSSSGSQSGSGSSSSSHSRHYRGRKSKKSKKSKK